MKKITSLVFVCFLVQAALGQDNMTECDLSKYELSWHGDGANISKEGTLLPRITRNNKATEPFGSAYLDLSDLNLEDNHVINLGLTEFSCLFSQPKRKNGIGHLARFIFAIRYENLNGTEDFFLVGYTYNYFVHKKQAYCEASYRTSVDQYWKPLGWKGRELKIKINKYENTLSINTRKISATIKRIKGIEVGVDEGADITISEFSVMEESNAYKAEKLNTEAMSKYELEDFPSCIDLTTRIIEELDDKNADAYKTRASAAVKLGYFKVAISDYEKAILYTSHNPESPQRKKALEEIYAMLGLCKLQVQDMAGAYDALLKGGYKGQIVIAEFDLENQLFTNNTIKQITPYKVLSEIETSLNDSIYTSNDIYNKYNNAVFMVITTNREGASQGSGFFIGNNGLAISNYHVFEGAIRGKEQVKLMNGGTYQVKEILGYDKDKDFIIFRVEGSGFTYIPITLRGYEIGDEVYAIGSPRGMQNTLSNGLVSQKRDNTKIQISVPIDHGSSGGALINQYGEVIGITSGGRDDTHANLNYAIDIRTIFNQDE